MSATAPVLRAGTAAGVPEGARVGEVLATLETGWAEEDFATPEETLRERLAQLIKDKS